MTLPLTTIKKNIFGFLVLVRGQLSFSVPRNLALKKAKFMKLFVIAVLWSDDDDDDDKNL